MAFYSGTCTSLTLIECDDDDSDNGNMSRIQRTGLTPGSTIWIRFWEYGGNQFGTFSKCAEAYTPPPPTTNDECANAITISQTATCVNTSGTTNAATASSQASGGCGGTPNDDVWYKFTATTQGAFVSLSNVVGTSTDMYFSVYNGTCASLGTPLVCSDPNSNTVSCITVGQTYYIRVYTYGSAANNTTFNICVQEATAYGTPATQDYCMAPAVLTEDPTATFSANTSRSYTSDTPSNLNSVFCGSIDR